MQNSVAVHFAVQWRFSFPFILCVCVCVCVCVCRGLSEQAKPDTCLHFARPCVFVLSPPPSPFTADGVNRLSEKQQALLLKQNAGCVTIELINQFSFDTEDTVIALPTQMKTLKVSGHTSKD